MKNTIAGVGLAKEVIQVCICTNYKVRSNTGMTHREFIVWLFNSIEKEDRFIFALKSLADPEVIVGFKMLMRLPAALRSTGQCNTCVKSISRCFTIQGHSWPFI